jgi:hypothetical protein
MGAGGRRQANCKGGPTPVVYSLRPRERSAGGSANRFRETLLRMECSNFFYCPAWDPRSTMHARSLNGKPRTNKGRL